MRREHSRDHGGGGAAVAVAAVHHARQGHGFPETFFAHLPVAKKVCPGTEQAEVVQGLHDGGAFGAGGVVGGGREQREGVVKMDDVDLIRADGFAKPRRGRAAPDRRAHER